MTAKRFFYVMLGLFCLLVIAIIGATVGGHILLKKSSDQLVSLKAENKSIEEQQVALVQAKKDLDKYKDLDTIAKSVVPQDKDQAKTIREINQIANDSGIQLKAFTFQTSTLGQSAPKAATEDNKASGNTGGTSTAPPLSQVKAVEGIPGVYSLELNISPLQSVTYYKFIDFLEKLENNRRTAHVDKISINPTEGGEVTFSLTLKVYVKP